jgi:hypothetical protein
MAKNRAYPLEFRANVVELVRSGKNGGDVMVERPAAGNRP